MNIPIFNFQFPLPRKRLLAEKGQAIFNFDSPGIRNSLGFGIVLTMLFVSIANSRVVAQVDKSKVEAGLTAYHKQKWDDAVSEFQNALQGDPDNPQLNYDLAASLYKKEKYEDALKALEKAQLSPDADLQENAFYNAGNTLFKLEKYAEAVEAYKKALDLNPNALDAKQNLELARLKMKNEEQKKQEQDQKKDQIKPSEYAKQLKAQAEILVSQRLYSAAYQLMQQGLKSDETVAAYQSFIKRLKDVADIDQIGEASDEK